MDEKTVWSTISGIFAEYALKIAASLLILILGSMLIRFIINRTAGGLRSWTPATASICGLF